MRGQPDFGQYAAKATTASISDMGEVAARLGSIVTYDKRGDVVDFDNFEEPIVRWLGYISGGVATRHLSNANAASGSQAYYMKTDAVSGDLTALRRFTAVLASERLGMEVKFSRLSSHVNLELQLGRASVSSGYYGAILISTAEGKLYVEDPKDTWNEVATLTLLQQQYWQFTPVKFVLDFVNNKYVRLLFADQEYDISAYDLYSGGFATYPSVWNKMQITNRNAISGEVWLDDFVLTQAEP